MSTHELVDLTDNDSHDEGTRAEMHAMAIERNTLERNAHDELGKWAGVRWACKPAGWSARNWKG